MTASEADAFVDAWAPAYFGRCERTGPEAQGEPPPALAPADSSLLYFAPQSLVDELLPLHTRPAARTVRRVFLVRVVRLPSAGAVSPGTMRAADSGPALPSPSIALRLGAITVRGALGRDAVRRTAQRRISQPRYCYEQALRRLPDLHGTVRLELVVEPSGAVSTVDIDSRDLRNESLHACLASAARQWTFPADDGGGVTHVTIPMTFSTR